MCEIWTSIILSAAIIFLYETDLVETGTIAPNGNTEFICVLTMELLTISVLPLSLRMFKINKIARRLKQGGAKALAIWGTTRMIMMCTPMVVNTYLHYLSMNVSFGYMAIIFFVCLIFIYPTMGRCIAETGGKA